VRKILVPAQNRRNYLPIDAEAPADATYLPPAPAPKEFSGAIARQNEQPPVVLYELVAGERRLRAAKHAELTHVPCIIINTDDSTSAELAIIENLLREDLNMFEQAEAFRRLIDEFMLTQEEVARRVSLSQSAVANKLRILRLSRQEREIILQAGLTERHARALLKLPDEPHRAMALEQIVANKWNVSNAEQYIERQLDEICREKNQHSKQKTQNDAIFALDLPDEPPIPEQSAEILFSRDENTSPDATTVSFVENSPPTVCRKGSIRDIRLFFNSIRNAATILEQTGVSVEVSQQEFQDEIVISARVRQPKR
jgi:ParB/RepB/Spo0J family partition protein